MPRPDGPLRVIEYDNMARASDAREAYAMLYRAYSTGAGLFTSIVGPSPTDHPTESETRRD
jgi:hypothetical protein